MLKYLQTSRDISPRLSVKGKVSLGSSANKESPTSGDDFQKKKLAFHRQFSLKKIKSASPSEGLKRSISRNRRPLSMRAKSCCIQPEESHPLDSNMRKFVQTKNSRPFSNWTTDDLCEWLRSNGLDRDDMLAIQFRSRQLTGEQLAQPEAAWEHMSRFAFKDNEHKQEVLLKLAESIRESRSGERKTPRYESSKQERHLKAANTLSHSSESIVSSSGYVSNSSASTALPSSHSDQDFSTTSSTSSSNKKFTRSASNSKSSPAMKLSSSEGEMTSLNQLQRILLYSDFDAPGQFVATELRVTKTTTTIELIQLFLDCSALVEDINLFHLNEVSYPAPDDKGSKSKTSATSRRLLENRECPFVVYKSFSASKRNTVKRLELSRGKGVMVKVTCRIADHRARSKQFSISVLSGVDHVIKLALRKFRLRNVDSDLFALCEVALSGDVVEVDKSSKRKWQNGVALVLCDRPSLESTRRNSSPTNRFFRSISTTSHSSQKSEASSGSDSWIPIKLDKKGLLNGEIRKSPQIELTGYQSYDGDLVINEMSPANKKLNERKESRAEVDALTVENALLSSQLREQEEQLEELRKKVSEVRRVLESGLQEYHDDALYREEEDTVKKSLVFDKELKTTEKQINNLEEMLGQLFCHQRQVLSKKNRDSPMRNGDVAETCLDDDGLDVNGETDIELRIATHQADLLALKHKHHVLDLKMSLFVANRKAEKFRHMITGSLYDIIAEKHSNIPYTRTHYGSESLCTLHYCELFSNTDGYGLVTRDEKGTRQNTGIRMKGTVLDCDHLQGKLYKGDRFVEVNGVNVQTCGSEFIARLLKETSSARIVVLRKSAMNRTDHDEIIPSPVEDESVDPIAKRFQDGGKFASDTGGVGDWREMTALQSDLAMLMRELETTACAKLELERDLAVRENRDLTLQSENARLKKQVEELTRRRQSIDYLTC